MVTGMMIRKVTSHGDIEEKVVSHDDSEETRETGITTPSEALWP